VTPVAKQSSVCNSGAKKIFQSMTGGDIHPCPPPLWVRHWTYYSQLDWSSSSFEGYNKVISRTTTAEYEKCQKWNNKCQMSNECIRIRATEQEDIQMLSELWRQRVTVRMWCRDSSTFRRLALKTGSDRLKQWPVLLTRTWDSRPRPRPRTWHQNTFKDRFRLRGTREHKTKKK